MKHQYNFGIRLKNRWNLFLLCMKIYHLLYYPKFFLKKKNKNIQIHITPHLFQRITELSQNQIKIKAIE
jgi:hypothetical protein